MADRSLLKRITSFFLDVRTIQVVLQIAFVIIVTIAVLQVGSDMLTELGRRNLTPNFDFLNNRAGFQLADAGDYTPDDTYLEAFIVGITNTLRVVIVGLVMTTVLGILVGIFLLSSNWLVRTIARVYVEILRNTPLLVQLFVWFYIVLLTLPVIQDTIAFPAEGITVIPLRWLVYLVAIPALVWVARRLPRDSAARSALPIAAVGTVIVAEWLNLLSQPLLRLETTPIAYLSNRGVAFPAFVATDRLLPWALAVLVAVIAAVGALVYTNRLRENTGRKVRGGLIALAILIAVPLLAWLLIASQPPVPVTVEVDGEQVTMSLEEARAQELLERPDALRYEQTPLALSIPRRQGLRYVDGTILLPEYTALLLGLVVYTSAFVAEIVRAGIQAVPHGQVEASRALGLSYSQALQLIILPQALRVIIPPLGNQYLNLAKNSSLAIAISYTDLFQVTNTIINQSGQSVSGIIMVMAAYLIMSLTIATIMNLINRRFQLVTR